MGGLDMETAKYGLRNIGTLSIDIQQPEASVSELSGEGQAAETVPDAATWDEL